MMDCIHAGAVDYLIKPLHLDVIKTLFLKIHRNQPDLKMHHSPLYQRIKEMTFYNMPKVMMNLYSNHQSINKYPSISKKRSLELLSNLCTWNFNPFDLTEQDLIHSAYLVFDQLLSLPELSSLNLKDQLYDFIIDLASVYHNDNPYHNFAHAVDVLQCLFYMLSELGLLPFTNKSKSDTVRPQDLLSLYDIFALLIAAIGHDAAHPGVNNMFLINTSNPLAILYNDQSVLESLHSVTLFQLLSKHGIDKRVSQVSPACYRDFRKIIISSILSTDMALHNEYVDKIKEQAKRLHSIDLNQLNRSTAEKERILLCSALIKCADISNVARAFQHSQQWAKLLVDEFAAQGNLEKEFGIAVSPASDDSIALEDSQINFIQFVALDLFKSLSMVTKEIAFAVDQLNSNLSHWESIKQKNEQTDHDDDDDDTAHMIPETGIKRSHSVDESYTSTAKRISLEKFHINMPLIAMTTYGRVNTRDEENDQEEKATGRPMYCQCSIQ
ncbi:HD-domain/PDEase-like protein [Rhizopus microsporus var. microsporus]|nr:HD-domain/PDEase-like protein [Rhizopus microsporus var. microsporus]